ncbi:hypothetical protein Tco_0058678 [Tanacetum coccineum]
MSLVLKAQVATLDEDYGTTGGSAAGGKSPSVLNRLLQDSLLTVEQGVPALPTLPFITSSVTASPLEEGGDHTDSVTGPSLRTMGPSARSVAPVMTTTTTVTAFVSCVAATTITSVDVGKDKDVPALRRSRNLILQENYIPECSPRMEHEQLFAEFNVSAARNLSLSSEVRMRAEYNILEKRKWKSLAEEKNNLLQVKDKDNLEAIEGSLQGEVASAKEHNGLLEHEHSALKLKVTSLESIIAEKYHELSDLGTSASSLRSQNQSLVNQVHKLETSSAGLREKLEMYEGSMKQLEEFQDNLMKPLEARLAEIDADFTSGLTSLAARIEHGQARRCLSDLESYNPSTKADFTSAVRDLRGLDFSLLRELSAKKDASTWDVIWISRWNMSWLGDKVVIGSQALFVALETCHPLSILPETSTEPPVTALITTALSTMVIHPNSDPFLLVTDYENPDLAGAVPEDVIPGPEGEGKYDPFPSAFVTSYGPSHLGPSFPVSSARLASLLRSSKLDFQASTFWPCLLLLSGMWAFRSPHGMTASFPLHFIPPSKLRFALFTKPFCPGEFYGDVGQLMVPVHHKQYKVVIGSQALSVALDTCHRRVRKMERNLAERLPFLKDVFVSIDHTISPEALAILLETSTEPPVTALITTALSTVVICPNSDPFLLVKDYENPDGVVPEDVIPGPEGKGKVEGSTKGDVDDVFSQFENEARDAVL